MDDGAEEEHKGEVYIVDYEEKAVFVERVYEHALQEYFTLYANLKRQKRGRKPHYLKEQSAFCDCLLRVQPYATTNTTYLGALARNFVSNVKRLGKNLSSCLLPRKKACIEENDIFYRVLRVVAPVLCRTRGGKELKDGSK